MYRHEEDGFTEGEWEHERLYPVHSGDVSIYARIGPHRLPRYICIVYGEGYVSKIKEERDANARLIVQAPMMLDLLRSCKVYLEDVPYDCEEVMSLLGRIESVIGEIAGRQGGS